MTTPNGHGDQCIKYVPCTGGCCEDGPEPVYDTRPTRFYVNGVALLTKGQVFEGGCGITVMGFSRFRINGIEVCRPHSPLRTCGCYYGTLAPQHIARMDVR